MTHLQHPMLTTQICFNTKYYTDHHISPLKMWKQATGKARHPAGMPVLLLFQIVSPDKWEFLAGKDHQLFFTYYSALSVFMETMAKSRDGKKEIICCAWLTEQ